MEALRAVDCTSTRGGGRPRRSQRRRQDDTAADHLDAARPDGGRVTVDGLDTSTTIGQSRARIGLVLADDRSLYWRLTGRQNLEFFARMVGLITDWRRPPVDELLERVGLAHRDKLVFGYSSGMRARLSIARALLADPPLLVLDEATRALDPLAAADIAELLRELRATGWRSSCRATASTRSSSSATASR